MDYVYAVASAAATTTAGLPVYLTLGEVWAADDPFVSHRPELFSDTPTRVQRTVIEETTANPGELRRTR